MPRITLQFGRLQSNYFHNTFLAKKLVLREGLEPPMWYSTLKGWTVRRYRNRSKLKLERERGLEPLTSSLENWCSTIELLPRKNGWKGWGRTNDQVINHGGYGIEPTSFTLLSS